MTVRYTPSTAGGVYDIDLTEDQWLALKDNPDYQLLSADDIAKMAAPPAVPAPDATAIAALQSAIHTLEAPVPPTPAVDAAGTAVATA